VCLERALNTVLSGYLTPASSSDYVPYSSDFRHGDTFQDNVRTFTHIIAKHATDVSFMSADAFLRTAVADIALSGTLRSKEIELRYVISTTKMSKWAYFGPRNGSDAED
jgi:hypothetical protein